MSSLRISFVLFALIIAYPAFSQPETNDKPAVHGMVIFGKHNKYASHLPMYHSPHDYQVIFEVSIDNISNSLLEIEQQKHPNEVTYTLEPEAFSLKDMIEHPSFIRAKLYRGHFERGGSLIADNVDVTFKKIVYARKITGTLSALPPEQSTSYILFGNKLEQFAAHLIRSKPSFDHIVQIATAIETLDLPAISIINNEVDTVPDINGNFINAIIYNHNAGNKSIDIQWQQQIYLEFTDLK